MGAELHQQGLFKTLIETNANARNSTVDAYLEEIASRFDSMRSQGEVFAREAMRAMLLKVSTKKRGILKFITGGRNVGKTRLLKELVTKHNDNPEGEIMAVYVNGRGGTLSERIKRASVDLGKKKWS